LKLHKEKEMADFRKWLFAFAPVALVLGLQASASAQVNAPAFACTANAGTPTIVRAEGVTELVGDLILNCTGGTPTPAGSAIPESNVQIFLNTNITSRILTSGNVSEATLLIDEPYPGGQTAVPPASIAPPVPGAPTVQRACQATNSTNCAMVGVGSTGVGLTGSPVGANGPYNGLTENSYNVFQGFQNGVNSVAWLGVPIDAPGTSGVRVIRITNVRANACLLGVSSTFIPTQIVMFVSVNGSQQVTINNPQQLVAYAQPGLVISNGSATYPQCNNLNVDSGGNIIPGGGNPSGPVNVVATEGFASAFKTRTYAQALGAPGSTGAVITDSTVSLQNIPGFAYNTESGFVAEPSGNGVGFGTTAGSVGLADTGTEISFSLASLGAGVQLSVPNTVYLVQSGTSTPTGGVAILVGSSGGTGATSVGISGATGSITYEIVADDPHVLEDLVIPVTVGFVSNTGQNLPATGSSTVAANFAPLSSTPTASSTAPIPRFCQKNAASNVFAINTCSCNLLFPFVTNQAGFDTGIAIANTSADTLNGVTPQQGTVNLTYYGGTTGGGAAPAAQTSSSVAAGSELVFTLSSGGNLGVMSTPGFQGYIIARANFQYCHGFAFISDMGAQKLAEGYLAIQLDVPGLERTGQLGENKGH
jgi:hypothetical protein